MKQDKDVLALRMQAVLEGKSVGPVELAKVRQSFFKEKFHQKGILFCILLSSGQFEFSCVFE